MLAAESNNPYPHILIEAPNASLVGLTVVKKHFNCCHQEYKLTQVYLLNGWGRKLFLPTFKGKHYKQIFGTAMGSPVSIVVDNLVMEDVEKQQHSGSTFFNIFIPLSTKISPTFHSPPKIWKRYVDDTFVMIHKNSVEDFFGSFKHF